MWKSRPKGTLTPWANTRTPRPRAITNRTLAAHFCGSPENAVSLYSSMRRSLIAWMLVVSLSLGGAFDAFAQSCKHQRKSKKPKLPPCRTGCKPDTSAPLAAAESPHVYTAHTELTDLAPALRKATSRAA